MTNRISVEPIRFHGIDCLRITSGGAVAVVARFGAQVLSWIPEGGSEMLFLSERASFDGGVAIRGGIPVCFPQFSGLGALPKHGVVRTRLWDVGAHSPHAARLVFQSDDETLRLWPHAFEAAIEVSLGARVLEVCLVVRNAGSESFAFTGALHTYLRVTDLDNVRLEGLAGCEYRDAAAGNVIRTERASGITFDGEVDRVYHGPRDALSLREGSKALSIASSGFADTVVWNPGAALCSGLADMAPDGFRRMVCVEAAAARLPVLLPGGASWRGIQTLSIPAGSAG